MKEKVVHTIKKYNLIEKVDNVLLGLSGGPDSLALFYILKDLQQEIEFKLHVAHVNHKVRGKEADEDEKFVRDICNRYKVPFYSKSVDMKGYAKKKKLSEEEAGREIRYNFFYEIINKLGGGKIAVAHNKDDQGETLIMRVLRGTGIDGLVGMDYINGNIIRPLLDVTREEIEKFCEENNIKPRIDKTNLKPIYGRNKIRLELIPYIQENFNEGIIDTLFRMSRVIKMDSKFLNDYSYGEFKKIVIEESNNKVVADLNKLVDMHKSIKARVIRLCIEKINKDLKGIEEKHVSQVIELIDKGITGKRVNISNNINVSISYDKVVFIKQRSQKNKKQGFKYKLNIYDKTYIPELNAVINSKIIDKKELEIYANKNRKYFNYDNIKGDLYVKTREPGDRFIPLGMKGSKKIKDFFIDQKVPREKRDIIPIVEDEAHILWIIGYRISELYKITDNTDKVLMLEYKKLEEE
ncbi:tRNA lysidine(34) synthetase TilS [Caldisalinibacter kiritimatiensis]|uniref:tRNA(Ile)-lysidine synthase n=1 Tax=Caldisalinibacter kiritimatiensis TaxID=1304284 RepID=R1AWW2_9FIRM|nr:tRNA lysidine(34) synthetase TilS [Caldisalinibacter kiritimatiensis]EOD01137.1 tRNA(Ile)-lysidine synthetase [Caldisalinibacter kiritimatiensis]